MSKSSAEYASPVAWLWLRVFDSSASGTSVTSATVGAPGSCSARNLSLQDEQATVVGHCETPTILSTANSTFWVNGWSPMGALETRSAAECFEDWKWKKVRHTSRVSVQVHRLGRASLDEPRAMWIKEFRRDPTTQPLTLHRTS